MNDFGMHKQAQLSRLTRHSDDGRLCFGPGSRDKSRLQRAFNDYLYVGLVVWIHTSCSQPITCHCAIAGHKQTIASEHWHRTTRRVFSRAEEPVSHQLVYGTVLAVYLLGPATRHSAIEEHTRCLHRDNRGGFVIGSLVVLAHRSSSMSFVDMRQQK